MLVDSRARVEEMVKALQGVREVAVDVEHHSFRTLHGLTCLIQVQGGGGVGVRCWRNHWLPENGACLLGLTWQLAQDISCGLHLPVFPTKAAL